MLRGKAAAFGDDMGMNTIIVSSVLHVGATGLVGQAVLERLLADARITHVVAPTRRPLGRTHPKLENPLVDFEALPEDAPWWQVDGVICTLGTTMRVAGSRAAFSRIDHDYPLAVARIARAAGAKAFALTSATGADARSWFFYNRVKGELEQALAALEFASLTHVRPGLIGGERAQHRADEALAARVLGALAPVLPRAWRICPAERIADALVEATLAARPGVNVVPASALAQP